MIVGRIEDGQIRLIAPLPEAWEGQTVKVEPCTPDDVLPGLEQRLAALHALGPMEYEGDERLEIERSLKAMDDLSRIQMQQHG
ncbi:MAG TPA: hypothetical protein VFV87_00835 [Pirellulaceae bacterium]|nr:hypothetical protein [Pirellulaceae bacterium]